MHTNPSEYLKNYFENTPKNQFLELRTISKSGKVNSRFFPLPLTEEVDVFIKNNMSNNLYYGLATRKTDLNGKKENCGFLPYLYIDIDCGNEGHKKSNVFHSTDEALQFISKFSIKPTRIIHSGNGLHLYWKLTQPVELNEKNILKVETIMKRLANLYFADSTSDVSRIFRLPFSFNQKGDTPKEVKILAESEATVNLEYFDFILSEKLDFNFNGLKSMDYQRAILGLENFGIDDRSVIDQKIITKLANSNFTKEQIYNLFSIYPTTGKALELLKKDPKKCPYLELSISKAFDESLHKNQMASKVYINPLDKYSYSAENGAIGYYENVKGTDVPLTNFIIELTSEVIKEDEDTNEKSLSYNGRIILSNKNEIPFKNLEASVLANNNQLNEFIMSKIGINGFITKPSILNLLIKLNNSNLEKIKSLNYGYNIDLTKYYTGDFVVSKDGFINEKFFFNESLNFDQNKIGLKKNENINEIKAHLENLLNSLKLIYSERNIYTILSSVLIPLIVPYLWEIIKGKPYILFKGPSGCGKTTLLYILSSFYGDFNSPLSCSSTVTSLSIRGHKMKDVIIPLDDLKSSNFTNISRINEMMTLIQNYSDSTSRGRATSNLGLRETKIIRGILAISAEDLVFTESSSIARGIIFSMPSIIPNIEHDRAIKALLPNNKLITPYIIKKIMEIGKEKLIEMFEEARNDFSNLCLIYNLSADNQARRINNFALLLMSLRLFNEFIDSLGINKLDLRDSVNDLSLLFIENNKLTDKFKPDEKFKEILWENIETGIFVLEDLATNSFFDKKNYVGCYLKNQASKRVDIIINLTNAYKLVNNYLREFGGLGVSKETLITKLTQNGDIESVPSGKINLGYGKSRRGVRWIGNYPKDYFFNPENLSDSSENNSHQNGAPNIFFFPPENQLPREFRKDNTNKTGSDD